MGSRIGATVSRGGVAEISSTTDVCPLLPTGWLLTMVRQSVASDGGLQDDNLEAREMPEIVEEWPL